MTKYKTFAKNNNLYFTITSGQFKNITYKYNTLTESNKLDYSIIKGSKLINNSNKYLFEQDIKQILADKLK